GRRCGPPAKDERRARARRRAARLRGLRRAVRPRAQSRPPSLRVVRGRGCPVSHPHGIHCLHIHRWDIPRWCATCRRSFEQFEGVEGQPTPGEPTPETRAAWMRLFEKYVDTSLAYAVLADIERGELPLPPSFDVEDLRPLPDWVREPSEN